MNMAKDIGLIIKRLEDDQEFQDCVLSLHHVYTFTFSNTRIVELVESNNGNSFSMVKPDSAGAYNKSLNKSSRKFLKTILSALIILGLVVLICGIFGYYSEGSFDRPFSLIAVGFTIIAVSILFKVKYK